MSLYQQLAETHYQIHVLYYKLYLKETSMEERQHMYELIDALELQAFELKAELHI